MQRIHNAYRLLLPLLLLSLGRLDASQIQLKDGRVLEGKLGRVGGITMAPLAVTQENAGPQLIVFLNDDLRRTYVSSYQVQKLLEDQPGEIEEKFMLHQQVLRNGRTVKSVGPPVRVDPFDEFGRRIFVMNTGAGQVRIIQVITEITPKWTKVEGHDYVWDMRMATSSIPREVLSKILNRLINRKDIEQRKKVARFYLQCERYEEAAAELTSIVTDFPDPAVKTEMETPLRVLKQLSTQRLIGELKLRRAAGQYNLVLGALNKFPHDAATGQSLQAAGSMLAEYKAYQSDRAALLKDFDALASRLDLATQKVVGEIRAEIDGELNPSSMGRMAAFRQAAGDASLQPDDRLARAISGWLLGENSAVEKLSLALSAYKVRGMVQKYLTTPDVLGRRKILEELGSEEAASPALVAKIIAAMKPAIQTPEPSPGTAGFYELEVAAQGSEVPVTYYVQLPPEYDPLRRYPAIVTLRGAGSVNAPQQIDWWAGEAQHGVRNGQAGRNGYIVIAPEWLAEHQKEYRYSGREYAAVADTLRDACRRFSIDTDRVYLSGHSAGGDAAWDIGLAHPDLWAGVIPISAQTQRYCNRYWENAKLLPFYIVNGELDGRKMTDNAVDIDRYMKHAYNVTVVEYLGRGHEHFSDEILRIYDWMEHFKRDFFPKEFRCVSMRPWDNYFWWVELDKMPAKSMIDPSDWPPPRGSQAAETVGRINAANGLSVRTAAGRITVWLSPEMLNLDRKVSIVVEGRQVNIRDTFVEGRLETILEDVRTRGDRQHPFWVKVDASTGRVLMGRQARPPLPPGAGRGEGT
jgi:predicted esterase